jgi:ribonuclease Z
MSRLSGINITFLGTSSAQPSSTRNHSSLALRLNGDVWLFDCGESTQSRIQASAVKMGKIKKIFITHTHGQVHQQVMCAGPELIFFSCKGDHIFGLLPLMASRLSGAGGIVEGSGSEDPRATVNSNQDVRHSPSRCCSWSI